jgi:L-lactate dehydrogenase complex protein LldG
MKLPSGTSLAPTVLVDRPWETSISAITVGRPPVEEDFIARASELGARVYPVGGRDEAVAEIVGIFRSSAALKVVVSPDLGELQDPITEALSRAGAEFVDGDAPEALAHADLGITRAALGVAETGSILVAGNESLPRLSSMLPLVHVAVLEHDAVVASLDEAGEYLHRVSLGPRAAQLRYATLVIGPSRTSDVEKTLTVGVHGPGELDIILLS